MKKRTVAGIGLLLMDLGVFAAVAAFLPRASSWGHSGPWSYFVNSRTRWDIAWAVLFASILFSAGVLLLLDSLSVFKEDEKSS